MITNAKRIGGLQRVEESVLTNTKRVRSLLEGGRVGFDLRKACKRLVESVWNTAKRV